MATRRWEMDDRHQIWTLPEAVEDPQTLAVLTQIAGASAEAKSSDAQLIAACRMAFAATHHSTDIGLALLNRATDLLSPTADGAFQEEALSAEGAYAKSTARWAAFKSLLESICSPI